MKTAYRRDWSKIQKQVEESRRRFEQERLERLKGRVHRPIGAVRISRDYGKNWKLYALCDECEKSIEPPAMKKEEGAAGALNCDWCGALNEMFKADVSKVLKG